MSQPTHSVSTINQAPINLDINQEQQNQKQQVQENNMRYIPESEYPNFKIWFNLLVFCGIGLILFLFKMFGIPTLSVPCLLDRGHQVTEPINRMCNDNPTFGHGIIIVSSLCIDFIVTSSLLYWFLNSKSLRLPIALFLFYILRIPHLYIYTPKFPDGFFFEYPGFPSISVPYGRQSDFYFSGHSGIMTLMFCEWRHLGFKKMQYLTGMLMVYVVFSLLVLRVHYSIDITAGIMFAHYLYIITQHYETRFNTKARQMQSWIQQTIRKIFKKKEKQ